MSQLLVYERIPRNGAIFARVGGLQLREVRSLTQLAQAMESSLPPVVAVEVVSEESENLLALMRHTTARKGRAAVIAMKDASGDDVPDVLLYAAGVDFIFQSMIDRKRVAALMRRRIRLQDSSLEQNVDVKSWAWNRLPWKRFASGGGS